MQAVNTNTKGWHFKNWGTWGWIETIIKMIAVVFALGAFLAADGNAVLQTTNHPRMAAVILLGLFTVSMFLLTGFRIAQREIGSVIFTVINALAHAALLIAMLRAPTELTYPIIFGVLYTIGQAVKLVFLFATGFTEGGLSKTMIRLATLALVIAYAVFTLLLFPVA